MIYEPLVMMNPVKPAEPGKPWLATKWKWPTTSPSGRVTIRDGVKWSDGKPMTADDVAYTFQLRQGQRGPQRATRSRHGRSPRQRQQGHLTFTSSQFVNQNKVLHRVRSCRSTSGRRSADPTTGHRQEPGRHRPVHAEVVHPADHDADGARRATGRTCRRSRSCATPRTTTTTRRPPRWPTARRSGASSSSRTYKAVYVDKDPAHHKLWFPPNLGIHGLWINTTKKPFDNPALRRAMNMVINRDDIFNQGEAGYFYPKVESVTGIPTPAGDVVHRAGVQGQEAHGRRRRRQGRAHRRRLQARGQHAEGPDRQAGHDHADRPGRLVRLP